MRPCITVSPRRGQHDILWETLTARQHMRFYARLKNTPREQVHDAVVRGLRQVSRS